MTYRLSMVISLALAAGGCGNENGGDEDTSTDTGVDLEIDVTVDTDAPDGEDTAGDGDAGDVPGDDDLVPVPSRVVILHTNDEHSHVLGIGPSVDDWPLATSPGDGTMKGNAYRRAAAILAERADASAEGTPTLTVSAGDYTMGTLFQFGSVFQGVDFKLMTLLGYDAVALGNHEFDFGASTTATMIENGGLLEGMPLAIPIVSSNIHFSADDGDDALEALYSYDDDGVSPVKGYSIETLGDGTTVGIIGVTGLDAALVAPFKTPAWFSLAMTDTACTVSWECTNGSCVEGFCTAGPLQDHATHMQALVEDTADAVRSVRALGVDLVLLLSHAGLDDGEAQAILAGTLDPGEAVGSEDIVLSYGVEALLSDEGLDGIDVIVSGHTHTQLDAPIVLPSAVAPGRITAVVQAGDYGRFLGRLEMFREDTGAPWQVDLDGSRLIPIDDTIDTSALPIAMRGMLDQATEGVMAAVDEALLDDALDTYNPGAPIDDDTGVPGDLFFHPLAESSFDVIGETSHRETALSHLATDAVRDRLNRDLYAPDPVRVYVQANGVIRDSLLASETGGILSTADTFAVLPLGVSPVEETAGYPVIDFRFTAAELKAGLEVGLSMGFDADSFFLGYSGARVEYDPALPAFDPANPTTTGRITKMTLWDPIADAGLLPWEDGYTDVIFDLSVTPDPFAGRSDELVHVATNLYVGLYIENFGLCPRTAAGDWDPLCGTCANTDADCEDGGGGTAHCLNDAVSPGLGRCVGSSIPAVIHYLARDPGTGLEIKEWISLVGYLQDMPDGDTDGLPDLQAAYDRADPAGALPDRICCVDTPLVPGNPCCTGAPWARPSSSRRPRSSSTGSASSSASRPRCESTCIGARAASTSSTSSGPATCSSRAGRCFIATWSGSSP